MKVAAFQKMNFTGEYWNYTTVEDAATGRRDDYYYDKDISFAVTTQDKGVLSVFSTEQLRYNAQIRNLRDAAGNLVFTEPVTGSAVVAYVGVSEPVFNVFGNIMGYRHDLSQGL